jgi:exodeoxyribonuclease-3
VSPRKPKPLTLHSWNVNGLRAVLRKGDFQSFLAAHQPDILCLQETKAERAQVEIDLPEYHEYWSSAVKKGYSGTAIFTRTEPLAVSYGFPKPVLKRFSFVDAEGRDVMEEGRVITAEFERFFVVTAYVPNAKDDLSRLPLREQHWDPALLAHCKRLEKTKPVIVCGDFNVAHTELDLANPKANVGNKGFTKEERAGLQAFIDAGFVDTLRMFRAGNGHYSWWSHRANARARNIGWRIDYVLVSAALRPDVLAADIHADVMGSDHCPVSVTLRG